MDLSQLIKAIVDNGIEPVILAVFIFIYLRNEKLRSKRADSNARQNKIERDKKDELLRDMIKSQQDQMTNLTQLVSNATQPAVPFSHEDEEFQSQVDNQIDNILAELRDITFAGRAMLVRYHNGAKDILGNSFLRMSCTNERVAVGVSPFKTQFQNQFRTLVGHLCNEVRDNGFYYIQDITVLKDDKHITMYEFFKTRNITGLGAYAVLSESGHVIGFILLEFLVSCPALDSLGGPMKNAAKEISRLLTLKKG